MKAPETAMPPHPPDTRLRLSALGLLVSIAVGLGLLVWGAGFHGKHQDALLEAQTAQSQAANAARLAPERLRLAQANAGLHAQFQNNGFLGAEQRAAWVTALGRAQTALRLDSLSWRLAPRHPSPLAAGLNVSAMDIAASPIDAQGLAVLLERLGASAPGRFTVERCALSLNPDGRAGLAECRLNWWTWDHGPSLP